MLCPSPLSLGEPFSWYVSFPLFFFSPVILIPKLSLLSALLTRIPQKLELGAFIRALTVGGGGQQI